MKRKEFKENIYEILNCNIDGLNYEEKIDLAYKIILEYEKDNEEKRDICNKGQKWSDEELEIILSDAPSRKNCMKYAKLFKRGYGIIEQIYRWSTTSIKEMDEQRKNDSFIQQIKRVCKKIGLRG